MKITFRLTLFVAFAGTLFANTPPVITVPTAQTTDEGVLLSFGVSATDPDGDLLTLAALNLPVGASFVDNGDGTGTFSWTPDYCQSGSYWVTFIAADNGVPSLADTDSVMITVNEVDRAPVVSVPGAQYVDEGQPLSFVVSGSDADTCDGDIVTLVGVNLPVGATFSVTDGNPASGTFSWTPGYGDAGVYWVLFVASDSRMPSLSDTDSVEITVGNVNRSPVITVPSSQTTDEGVLLSFGVSASDPDGDLLTLTALNLPVGASFVDNGDGTGTFSWTPDYCQSGSYWVTFIAADNGVPSLADTDSVMITVNEVDRAPILSDPGSQSVPEGTQLSFTLTGSDPDTCEGDVVFITSENMPVGATFTSDTANPSTGVFTWTPDYTQSGSYTVSFVAFDNKVPALSDTILVNITVTETGNHPPVLDSIGPQTVNEGDLLTINLSALDPDGDSVYFSATGLPTGSTLADNGDGTAVFQYTPTYYDAGVDTVVFYVTDAGSPPMSDEETVLITILDVNQPPILDSIGPKSVDEGDTLVISVHATDPTDPDGGPLSLTVSNPPNNSSFIDNGDGTGTFTFTPDYDQAGTYTVRFYATDSDTPPLSDYEDVIITVNNVNRPPVLDTIGYIVLYEGDTLIDTITAHDPDGDPVSLTIDSLLLNASFVDLGNDTAIFTFTPDYNQAGVYTATFTASDGSLTDYEVVPIQVLEAGNHAPILDSIGPKSVVEGDTLSFTVTSHDIDYDPVTLQAFNLPENAQFADNGDGTGDFTFIPTYIQAGSYQVLFTASDTSLADSEWVTINVIEAGNQPPQIFVPDTQWVNEGDSLLFQVTATDPENDPLVLTAAPLPTNATFTDNGDGTGDFAFYPDYHQAGEYIVNFTVQDTSLADSGAVVIEVIDVDLPPELDPIMTQTVQEGETLIVNVHAVDPDSDAITLSIFPLRPYMSFVDNGDGTGVLTFAPDYSQAGLYPTYIYASDSLLVDTVLFNIIVYNVNRPPVLDSIGPKSIVEGDTLEFVVTSSDPDGQIPSLSASPLPENALFNDNGDGTGIFRFVPNYLQSGTYFVLFVASDGDLADSENVQIDVIEAGNQAPIIDSIPPIEVFEWETLSVLVSSVDPDGPPPSLRAENIPLNSSFVDNGDGTGTFLFLPDCYQAGVYNINIIAVDVTDTTFQDTASVSITVLDYDTPPILTLTPDTLTAQYGDTIVVDLMVKDKEASYGCDLLNYSVINDPGGVIFINSDTTATYYWVPSGSDIGLFKIGFVVDDGNGAMDTAFARVMVMGPSVAIPKIFKDTLGGIEVTYWNLPIGKRARIGVELSNVSSQIKALRIRNVSLASGWGLSDNPLRVDITNAFIPDMSNLFIGLNPGENTGTFWYSLDTLSSSFSGFSIVLDTYDALAGWSSYDALYREYDVVAISGDSLDIRFTVSSSSLVCYNALVDGPVSWNVAVSPDTFCILPNDSQIVRLTGYVPTTETSGGRVDLILVNRFDQDTSVFTFNVLLQKEVVGDIISTDSLRNSFLALTGNVSIGAGNNFVSRNSVMDLRNLYSNVDCASGSLVDLEKTTVFSRVGGSIQMNFFGDLNIKGLYVGNSQGVLISGPVADIGAFSIISPQSFGIELKPFITSLKLEDVFIDSTLGEAIKIDSIAQCTLRNVNIEGTSGYDLSLKATDLYFIDGAVDTTKLLMDGISTLHRINSLYLTLINPDSVLLESVYVSIFDNLGTPIFYGYTDKSATIGPLLLETFEKGPSGVVDRTPYTIDLNYKGYDTMLVYTPDISRKLTVVIQGITYTRGDANASGTVDVADAVYLLSHIFPSPQFPCMRTADCNLDSTVNIGDVSYLLDHLFPSPSLPPPDSCGTSFADTLPCESYPPCGWGIALLKDGKSVAQYEVTLGSSGIEKDANKVIPVEIYCSENISAFQITLRGNVKYNEQDVRVSTERCVTKNFDYFDYFFDGERLIIVGIASLVPSTNGIATRFLNPGRYKIANILVDGRRDVNFEVEKVVLANEYGFNINKRGQMVSGVQDNRKYEIPRFYLREKGPNPFRNSITFEFSVPVAGNVEVSIYNQLGQRVRTLFNGYKSQGFGRLNWDGTDEKGVKVSAGVYFCKLETDYGTLVKKMVLMK